MITAFLNRGPSTSHGTFGYLSVPDYGFGCFTGELPWKNNRIRFSCVPKGTYTVKIRQSPKFGAIFHLTNVEGRTYILIHSGNYSGDVEKGFKTHTLGCILLGKSLGYLAGQKAVLNSRLALKSFMLIMKNEPFKLVIK